MKVYVQDPVTHSFLCQDGNWSKELDKARDFITTADAVTFCTTHVRKHYQILVRFSDPAYDIILPGPS